MYHGIFILTSTNQVSRIFSTAHSYISVHSAYRCRDDSKRPKGRIRDTHENVTADSHLNSPCLEMQVKATAGRLSWGYHFMFRVRASSAVVQYICKILINLSQKIMIPHLELWAQSSPEARGVGNLNPGPGRVLEAVKSSSTLPLIASQKSLTGKASPCNRHGKLPGSHCSTDPRSTMVRPHPLHRHPQTTDEFHLELRGCFEKMLLRRIFYGELGGKPDYRSHERLFEDK